MTACSILLPLTGCGSNNSAMGNQSGSISTGSSPPPSDQFLYATGTIPGNETQIFGYRIQSDGSLSVLSLPGLISPFCCHELTSTGTFIYVPGFDNGLAAFNADPQSGQLTPLTGSPFPGLPNSAEGAPVACASKFLYVASSGGAISGFTLDSHGIPTQMPGSPFPTGLMPRRPVMDPMCRFLFVSNGYDPSAGSNGGEVFAYTVDPTTGALTPVAGSPFALAPVTANFFSLAVDTTGKFLYITQTDAGVVLAFSIASDGSLAAVPGSPFSAGNQPEFSLPVAVGTKQFLYVANFGSNDIEAFVIDPHTGTLTMVSHSSDPAGPDYLVASGSFLYALDIFPDDLSAYTINADGTLRQFSNNLPEGAISYQPVSATVLK
jgi:6-phosphogluconolactonase (cycloisomerase 2 family)